MSADFEESKLGTLTHWLVFLRSSCMQLSDPVLTRERTQGRAV